MNTNTRSSTPDDLIEHLRELDARIGPSANKHDRAITLINACLLDGVDTKRRIIGVLRHVGLKPGHVAYLLDDCTGGNAEAHHWRVDAEGRYSPHQPA